MHIKNLKKLFVILLLLLTFSFITSAGGLPVIDLSNLAQAISSLEEMINFYNSTIASLKEYKQKIESIGKGLSNFDVEDLLSSLSDGMNFIKKIKSYLTECQKNANELFDETEKLFGSFDEKLYSYFNINTNSTFKQSIQALRGSLDYNSIINNINNDLDDLEGQVKKLEEQKQSYESELNNRIDEFTNKITDAQNYINNLVSSNSDSAVALMNINIKNTELSSLINSKLVLETSSENFLKEVETQIKKYKDEYTEINTSVTNFVQNLKDVTTLKNNNKKTNKVKDIYSFN